MEIILQSDKWDLFSLSKNGPGEGVKNGSFPEGTYFTGIARSGVFVATNFYFVSHDRNDPERLREIYWC
jgi:hypothetical protein